MFGPYTEAALGEACDRAWALWADAPRLFAVRRQAMAKDFSWDLSAEQYEAVYAVRPAGTQNVPEGRTRDVKT